ncbi:MAG: NAD(P)/FAD-dependent oxidoreductase [Candidatus Omnitrophota bacterium]
MKRILIIGGSAAGVSCAQTIRVKDSESQITIVTKEAQAGYARYRLAEFLAGEITAAQLSFRDEGFFKSKNIELVLNQEIERIDIKKKQAVAKAGEDPGRMKFDYDILVLATGASNALPDLKGINKNGVFGFREIAEVKDILEIIPVCDTACVMGNGIPAIKAANAFKRRGLEVKLISAAPPLGGLLDAESSEALKKHLLEKGIEIIADKVNEILGNGDVKAVRLENKKVLACQIAVVAMGTSPNVKLIREVPIACQNGVVVNEFQRTNIEDIYACGDVCAGSRGLWPDALEQGRVAGENICGNQTAFVVPSSDVTLDIFGLNLNLVKEPQHV